MEKSKLYADWLKAKKAEEKARKNRIDIEKQIEEILPQFEEQSKTLHEEGFKIVLKKSESWSFDQIRWENTRLKISPELRPEKIKYDVDKKGLEFLKEKYPDIYRQVSDCVSYKTGKTSFTIERE